MIKKNYGASLCIKCIDWYLFSQTDKPTDKRFIEKILLIQKNLEKKRIHTPYLNSNRKIPHIQNETDR